MLLELLSDFQISIPELGRIEARTHPVVLLTSNNSRELTEALKRRCLYLWLDYPTHRARAGDRPPARARAAARRVARSSSRSSRWCASSTSRSRRRSPSRSTGRARCCCSAPTTSTRRSFRDDDVDHRQAPHRPRHGGRAGRRAARAATGVTLRRADRCSSGDALRTEGVAIGTSELNDAFAALGEVPWTRARRRSARRSPRRSPSRPRTGASSTSSSSASSSAPPRAPRCDTGVREATARTTASPAASGSTSTRCASRSCEAIRDGDEAAMRDLARLAIAAFGRRGEGSGVLGVDVQRIRRALGLRSEPGGSCKGEGARTARSRATRSAASRRTCGASSSARRSSARRRCRRRGR